MRVEMLTRDEAARARGTVVVIDVLRAFTTAAVVLDRGASAVVLVSDVDEALRLRGSDPSLLLMGERDGAPIAGFDLSNSPSEALTADVAGRRIVHRTTAGTRGVVAAQGAQRRVAASFVCAGATVRLLRRWRPSALTFVVTGAHSGRDGDEDRALADHLLARLDGDDDATPYLQRVRAAAARLGFGSSERPELAQADVDIACDVDRYDHAMPIDVDADGRPLATFARTAP